MNRRSAAVSLALLFTLPGAGAAEINVWTARALATVLAEVGPQFERESGHTIKVFSGLPADFAARYDAGKPLDLVISGAAPIDSWIKDGRLLAGTRTEIARSGIGVEVRAGAPKPDISSLDAFKRALVEAKSIGYLKSGSGIYLHGLFERLGIAEAVKDKAVRPDSDIVSEMVARGEVELGMVVITQIVTTPGVELVGPLPTEIQSYVTFTAAVHARFSAPDAARQLIGFLTGPGATPVIRAQGMEPVYRTAPPGSAVDLRYGKNPPLNERRRQALYAKAIELLESSQFNSRDERQKMEEEYRRVMSRKYLAVTLRPAQKVATMGGEISVRQIVVGLNRPDYASSLHTVDDEGRIVVHGKYSGGLCIELLNLVKSASGN
jgi:molybdate transport system substrate-binding protein